MSKIKSYTAEEIARNEKNRLVSSCEACKHDLAEIVRREKEIKNARAMYDKEITRYRIDSVNRVLDYIRSEYRAGRVCDLEILLCHCQNKLNGNIDGVELDLDEHLRDASFVKGGEVDAK